MNELKNISNVNTHKLLDHIMDSGKALTVIDLQESFNILSKSQGYFVIRYTLLRYNMYNVFTDDLLQVLETFINTIDLRIAGGRYRLLSFRLGEISSRWVFNLHIDKVSWFSDEDEAQLYAKARGQPYIYDCVKQKRIKVDK